MKPTIPIKLVSELLDLPIRRQGRALLRDRRRYRVRQAAAGKETQVKALLVGPGAYEGRMPGWAFWLVRKVAGDRDHPRAASTRSRRSAPS